MLLLLLLFCQRLVAWPMKQQYSTRGLPPAWPPNGIYPTAQQCPGCDADSPSLFFSQRSNASGVLVLAVDMWPSPRLHQWTWSSLSLTLSKLSHLSLFICINSLLVLFTCFLLYCGFIVNLYFVTSFTLYCIIEHNNNYI